MTTHVLSPGCDDAELVAQSLAGNRSAFGQIVARYQSLICALAFSATGNLSRSEELAQETFVTAWQILRELREPGKLRAWLCGIARNTIHGEFRRLGREPVFAAAPLESALEVPSPEPLPPARAISNEEAALLWREVGQLPEIYREPLILFYREEQSVKRVAQDLELSEDAVMQRLARGRKQLHERMLVFVESALAQTNPGAQFTLSVQAALPILAASAQVTATTAAAKGATMAKSGSMLGALAAFLAPFLGVFASMGLSWSSIRNARSARERRFAVRWNSVLYLSMAGLILSLVGVSWLGENLHWGNETHVAAGVAIWWGFAMVVTTLLVFWMRRLFAIREQDVAAEDVSRTVPKRLVVVIAEVLGVFASCYWMVWLAWATGDRRVAGALVGVLLLLAAVNIWLLQGKTRFEAQRLSIVQLASVCGAMLFMVNWRLNVWLAWMYGVDRAGMEHLLPMGVVHLLTIFLLLWVWALLAITKPDEAE